MESVQSIRNPVLCIEFYANHSCSSVYCTCRVIIYTALFWVFANHIGNNVVQIIVKVLIAGFFGLLELALFANSMIPWLESKNPQKPRARRID